MHVRVGAWQHADPGPQDIRAQVHAALEINSKSGRAQAQVFSHVLLNISKPRQDHIQPFGGQAGSHGDDCGGFQERPEAPILPAHTHSMTAPHINEPQLHLQLQKVKNKTSPCEAIQVV